ncbi:MAG: HAD family phosphatase [Pseudomonadales bacterium]|nr:HAD family phosphatase [Pseudomonadales bacterium]
MSQDIKLVALDIDGTLLAPGVAPDALPDDSIVEVVAALRARNIIVMLATGRMYPGAASIAAHLGIEEPLICQQGASIHERDGRLRHGLTIDQDIAFELYEYAMRHQYSVAWFDHERYLVTSPSPAADYFAAVSGVEIEIDPRPHESGIAATGIDIVSHQDVSTDVHRFLEARYGTRVGLLDFTAVTAIHAPGSSKGNALALFASELGIEQSQVLAIGDGINDVSMLTWAGQSATPAHGDAFAKDAAGEVLIGDGVSGVVARLQCLL